MPRFVALDAFVTSSSQPLTFFVSAAKGLVSVVTEELRALGASELRENPAGVHFSGDIELGLRACLWLRSASRVLVEIAQVYAEQADQLYVGVRDLDMAHWLDPGRSFAVSFHGSNHAIRHTGFGVQKVKDAVMEGYQKRHGRRLRVEPRRPTVASQLPRRFTPLPGTLPSMPRDSARNPRIH